jgi:sugar/nucleoside kinase (ribokinase family)
VDIPVEFGQAPPMPPAPAILCIGAVLWDVIGRASRPMAKGDDVPGRISRLPGGVACNLAQCFARFGLAPAVLTAIGTDAEGDDLIAACEGLGIDTRFVHRSALPTDRYMAIEDRDGLVAAVADAHSLEAAGEAILAPLADGRLGRADAPYAGTVALDGNLTPALMATIAASPLFAGARLAVAPASPGKAERLTAFLGHPSATLYVNLAEARTLAGDAADAATAARALIDRGAARTLVTDGPRPAALADRTGVHVATPPHVTVARVTGAGDTCMAAHLRAEAQGLPPAQALARALAIAAAYVSGKDPE